MATRVKSARFSAKEAVSLLAESTDVISALDSSIQPLTIPLRRSLFCWSVGTALGWIGLGVAALLGTPEAQVWVPSLVVGAALIPHLLLRAGVRSPSSPVESWARSLAASGLVTVALATILWTFSLLVPDAFSAQKGPLPERVVAGFIVGSWIPLAAAGRLFAFHFLRDTTPWRALARLSGSAMLSGWTLLLRLHSGIDGLHPLGLMLPAALSAVALLDLRRYALLRNWRSHRTRLERRIGDANLRRLVVLIDDESDLAVGESDHLKAPADVAPVLTTLEDAHRSLQAHRRMRPGDGRAPAQIQTVVQQTELTLIPLIRDWFVRGLLEKVAASLGASAAAELRQLWTSPVLRVCALPTELRREKPEEVSIEIQNVGPSIVNGIRLTYGPGPGLRESQVSVAVLLPGSTHTQVVTITAPARGESLSVPCRTEYRVLGQPGLRSDESLLSFSLAGRSNRRFQPIGNQFSFGQPERNAKRLVGRRDLIRAVRAQLGTPRSASQPILICGPRGSGKTSVLHRLHEDLASTYDCLFYRLSTDDSSEDFDRLLEFVSQRRGRSKPRLALVDDLIVPAEMAGVEGGLTSRAAQLLEQLVDVHLVATGGTPIDPALTGRFAIFECSALGRQDLIDLLDVGLRTERVEVADDVVDELERCTGGNPQLAKLLCNGLVVELNTMQRRHAGVTEVRRAARRVIAERTRFLQEYFDPLSPLACLLGSVAAARDFATVTSTDATMLLSQGAPPIRVDGKRAAQLLGELQGAGVVVHDMSTNPNGEQQRLTFRGTLLMLWLKQQLDDNTPWMARLRERLSIEEVTSSSESSGSRTLRDRAVSFFRHLEVSVEAHEERDLILHAARGLLAPYGRIGLRCFDDVTPDALDALRSWTLTLTEAGPRPVDRLAFMLTERDHFPDAVNLRLESFAHEGLRCVPLNPSWLLDGIREGKGHILLSQLLQFEPRLNPYDVKEAIWRRGDFYDRTVIVGDLLRDIAACNGVGVFGMRKLGKSSVIMNVKQRLGSHVVVSLDCQKLPGARALLSAAAVELDATTNRLLGKKLGDAPPLDPRKRGLPELLERFEGAVDLALRRAKQVGLHPPIVLMIDEVDVLVEHLTSSREERQAYVEFFRRLRAYGQGDRSLVTVVAGLNPSITLNDLGLANETSGNPAFLLFKVHRLQCFSRDELGEMLRGLGARRGVSWQDDAVAAAHRASGGHPYMARLIASLMLGRADASQGAGNRGGAVMFSAVDVEAGVEQFFAPGQAYAPIIGAYYERVQEASPLASGLLWSSVHVDGQRERLIYPYDNRDEAAEALDWLCTEGYGRIEEGDVLRPFCGLLELWIRRYRRRRPDTIGARDDQTTSA